MQIRLISFIALLILVVFSPFGVSAASQLPARISTEAAVTLKVAPRSVSGGVWEFELTFDTHSRTLDDDLAKTAVLVTDGVNVYSPVKWLGDPPGGHHRRGILQFKPVAPVPVSIELRITREGELQPRSFKWSLK
jgi:hypothetical protein